MKSPRTRVLECLARAGDHPLMYSFPQGALFTFDTDLRYLSAGGLGLVDVGLSREMLEGRTIFEAFPAETAQAIEPYYRAALAGQSTTIDVPYEGRIYSQRLAPMWDSEGAIVAGLGFTQDVTEARRAERALRESEERNRLTFEHAPIGEALVELDGRWRRVNQALCTLLGYSELELLTMTFQDITHPDDLDLDLDHLRRLVAGEIGSYQMEKRYYTRSGRIVWVLLSVALVRAEDGTPLYFVSQMQDVTERKEQHEALRDLTSMLAHDLRTPTTVISGFAELLLEAWDNHTDDFRRDVLTRILRASGSMQSILENSLTSSTLDAQGLQAEPQRVDVSETVHEVLSALENDLAEVRIDGVTSAKAWVDPTHLTQVLTNLVSNAIKYGGSEVTVETSEMHGEVLIRVADNGDGVDPEFVPRLFDKFSRSPQARRGEQRGTGLGLHIVRDLLELNSGSIRYRRSSSGGAGFDVLLPSADAAAREDAA